MMVAAGEKGTILTSPRGTNWTEQPSGISVRLWDVVHGKGRFVAVGAKGTILVSADGQTWTQAPSGTVQWLTGIAYGNGLFAAVGGAGTILTSPDGLTWTARRSGTEDWFGAITYADDRFVAVSGMTVTAVSSRDGVRWTPHQPGTKQSLYGVAYGDGRFVAVGSGGAMLTSPDGMRWQMREDRRPTNWGGVAYGDGLFVAVGEEGALATSSDGLTWIHHRPMVMHFLKGVVPHPGGFIAAGGGGTLLAVEPDGSPGVPGRLDPMVGAIYITLTAKGEAVESSPLPVKLDSFSTLSYRWSPDGKSLAYDSGGSILIFHLPTGGVTAFHPGELGLGARYLGAPSWSPARPELALFFSTSDRHPEREEIRRSEAAKVHQGYAVLDPSTKTARVLYQYEAPFVPRPPALWSAGGERLALAFSCALVICDPVGLVVVDRRADRAERVGEQPYQVAWEPNGPRLAYNQNSDSRLVYILTSVDGGWRRDVIWHGIGVEGIAWRPLGRR